MNHSDLNYLRDHRNQPAPSQTVIIDEVEIELATKWQVCSVCDGDGKHVNPSIDCNGLTEEDFCEDYDFREAYMDGVYDVTCSRCGGRTTERVVDWDQLEPHVRDAYQQQLDDDARDRAEHLAEIRAGA